MLSRYGAVGLLSIALATACSFRGDGSKSVQPDTPVIFDPDGNQVGWFTADTVADFTEAGATSDQMGTEPEGAIAPGAYYYGGWIARGVDACPFATKEAIDFNTVVASTPTGTAFVNDLDMDDDELPPGAKVVLDTSWMYWLEGEVLLDAGATPIHFESDDFGAVEIAEANGTFTRVITNGYMTPPTDVSYTASAAGWHPIRALICQTNGNGATIKLQVAGKTVPRNRMRARVEALRGSTVTTWTRRQFGGVANTSLMTEPLYENPIDVVTTLPPGATTFDDLSMHWSGQIRGAAGDYAIHADTDDGHRIVIDAVSIDKMDICVNSVVSDLAPQFMNDGWQRLVVDYNQCGGIGNASIKFGAAGSTLTTIPVDKLRPAAPAFGRIATFRSGEDDSIPNSPTKLTRTFAASGFPDEIVVEAWLTYEYTHGMPMEIEITVAHGVDAPVKVRSNSGMASPSHHRIMNFADKPVDGDWVITATDVSGGMTGNLTDLSMTLVTRSGPPAVAQSSSWISATRRIDAVAIDTIRLDGTIPAGTTAMAFVRTCAATPCKDEVWTGPYASGDVVTAPPNPFAQLRIDLTALGETAPRIDLVELQYRFMP